MSFWKVAAAQYEPRKTSLTEQVAHHLEFVRPAARQQSQLLVFPSLSYIGYSSGISRKKASAFPMAQPKEKDTLLRVSFCGSRGWLRPHL